MKLLALDTTGKNCAVALRQPGQDDRVICEAIGRGHAERLAPMVRELLDAAGITPGALDRIGVTTGPGSFAGTRVGVAFARGLALATGASAYGISNLAIWAQMTAERPLAVLHDAKRSELILQIVRADGTSEAPQRLSYDAARQACEGLALAGSGAGLIGGESRVADTLDMSAMLDLTARAAPEQTPPAPFYARPPDAKLPGGVDA